MNRLLIVSALTLAAVCVIVAVRSSNGGEPAGRVLAHDVYFTLNDPSPEARQQLVDACKKHLSGHAGTVFFATGIRASEMDREVNDQVYDVSLHVYFEDLAAHDAYQQHPRHQQFIAEMQAGWKTVRVFDSWVETGS